MFSVLSGLFILLFAHLFIVISIVVVILLLSLFNLLGALHLLHFLQNVSVVVVKNCHLRIFSKNEFDAPRFTKFERVIY